MGFKSAFKGLRKIFFLSARLTFSVCLNAVQLRCNIEKN